MSSIIDTIKRVALEAVEQCASQVLFGKVESTLPLRIKVSDKLILTDEFIVLDSPVDQGEDVALLKYTNANKYFVLSTIHKTYATAVNVGGIALGIGKYAAHGQWKDLGEFTITHYCCEKYPHICNAGAPYKTATGTTPHVGGCAVDPKVIPLGSYIKINDVVYHAEDTGGAIKGNRVDIVTETHKEAWNKGKFKAQVFLKVGD
jgi:3D (Asp-Asp-Asp) domain-containing protein